MKKQIIISFIFIVNLYATTSLSIDAQIAQIKEAPESERVALMNQFKRDLILMNQTERENAIVQLQNNQTEHTPVETSLANQNSEIIYNLQQSNIEQHIQTERTMNIEEQIQEHQNIPPINTIPNGEQNQVPTPAGQTPEAPNSIPNPVPQQAETPIEIPTQNPPVSPPETQEPTIPQPVTPPNSNPVQEGTTPQVPSPPSEEPANRMPMQGGNFR